jgi:hypothetical protein
VNMTLKTAAAFFAFAAITGAAYADDAKPTDANSAVLEKIYDAIDKNRAEAFDFVIESAETRVDQRLVSLDETAESAQAITIASN